MRSAKDRYIDAACKHGKHTLGGYARDTNRAYDRIAKAIKELRTLPDKGESVLLPMLDHDDLSVVTWAAFHLLPLREKEAIAALECVAAGNVKMISFDAEMTLREWRAGRLKVD